MYSLPTLSPTLVSMIIFLHFRKDDYKSKGAEATLLNWVGVLLIIFGVLVVYLAQNPRYKRLNRPEDEMLLTETLHE